MGMCVVMFGCSRAAAEALATAQEPASLPRQLPVAQVAVDARRLGFWFWQLGTAGAWKSRKAP
jgi:hypothetical protein